MLKENLMNRRKMIVVSRNILQTCGFTISDDKVFDFGDAETHYGDSEDTYECAANCGFVVPVTRDKLVMAWLKKEGMLTEMNQQLRQVLKQLPNSCRQVLGDRRSPEHPGPQFFQCLNLSNSWVVLTKILRRKMTEKSIFQQERLICKLPF